MKIRCIWALGLAMAAQSLAAQAPDSLPSPLKAADVVRLARERRPELAAARSWVRAAAERPAIVSALEDPMLAPSIDHLPYQFDGFDRSITIEQRFPLSRVRKHRKQAALADVDRAQAGVAKTTLDVEAEALNAFFMLYERRQSAAIVEQQLVLSRQIVGAANARYAGGTGTQSEVLRAEVEVSRLGAVAASFKGEIRAAEAMLNASLARDTDAVVPELDLAAWSQEPPDWSTVKARLPGRPELSAGKAEIARAAAETDVMRDMYKPMLTVRTGTAYSMTEGRGAMLMVGMTLPIWRKRLRAGVAEAQAMGEMAKSDLDAMARMVEGEAARALNQLQAAKDRNRIVHDEVVPRARYAIDPALSSYSAGRLPLVSVLESVQTFWAAQSDLIQSEVDLGMAWVRLGRAMGTQEGLAP
jgi:outer membrane protein, heavy metal efflux system